MDDTVLATWHFITDGGRRLVMPDGCRDVIICAPAGDRPFWFYTDLDNCARAVDLPSGVALYGFRLKPGVELDEAALQAATATRNVEPDLMRQLIPEMTRLSGATDEILQSLCTDFGGPAGAADHLGIALRTLQRHCQEKTSRSPQFWRSLARARKAARQIILHGAALIEVAHSHGYSDQAHMTREFRRWFGLTPGQLKSHPEAQAQLRGHGYG